MQPVVFDFKSKTVGVVGSSATQRALANLLAAQQKLVANSPATTPQPQVK
jgi:hypothetical protein